MPERLRGRATSVVTGIAYLGFLAGPVYIGFWAEAVGLPGAMTALAGLAVTLALLVPLAMRYGTRHRVPVPAHASGSAAP